MYHDILLVGSDAGKQKILRMKCRHSVKTNEQKVSQRDDFLCPETMALVFCDSLTLMHACVAMLVCTLTVTLIQPSAIGQLETITAFV